LSTWEDELSAAIARALAEGATPKKIDKTYRAARSAALGKKPGRPRGSLDKEKKSQSLVKKLAIKRISDPLKGRYTAAREIEDSLPAKERVTW
jgi:uncharacterized protein YfiM (DUF2279 family)